MSEIFHLSLIQMFNINLEFLWQLDHNCPSISTLFLYTVKSGQFSTLRRLNMFSKWHSHDTYALYILPLIVLKELISAWLLWTGLEPCVDLILFFTRNTDQSRKKTTDPCFLALEKDHSSAQHRLNPGTSQVWGQIHPTEIQLLGHYFYRTNKLVVHGIKNTNYE